LKKTHAAITKFICKIRYSLKQVKHTAKKLDVYKSFHFIKNISFQEKANFNNQTKREPKSKLTINWVIPNVGLGGGGHLNIFRFIRYFQSQGHLNRIYIIGDHEAFEDASILDFINAHYFKIGNVECYRGSLGLKYSDVTFATSWQTAYYVYYDDNTLLKAYFVQDYEPLFYPMSSEYVFAEMTYGFGFYHVCASSWLGEKVIKGGKGTYYALGVDLNEYKILPDISKNDNQVFVYLRSNTPRRATEIILLALTQLKEINHKVEIVFAGEKELAYDIPFSFKNLGICSLSELPKIYNESCVALVGSLTNYSLLPQEIMACGCLVVDLMLENNISVHKEGTVVLAGPSPYDIAKKIDYYLTHKKARIALVDNALEHVKTLQWQGILQGVEAGLLKEFNDS
jgi:hypothetical protein